MEHSELSYRGKSLFYGFVSDRIEEHKLSIMNNYMSYKMVNYLFMTNVHEIPSFYTRANIKALNYWKLLFTIKKTMDFMLSV